MSAMDLLDASTACLVGTETSASTETIHLGVRNEKSEDKKMSWKRSVEKDQLKKKGSNNLETFWNSLEEYICI